MRKQVRADDDGSCQVVAWRKKGRKVSSRGRRQQKETQVVAAWDRDRVDPLPVAETGRGQTTSRRHGWQPQDSTGENQFLEIWRRMTTSSPTPKGPHDNRHSSWPMRKPAPRIVGDRRSLTRVPCMIEGTLQARSIQFLRDCLRSSISDEQTCKLANLRCRDARGLPDGTPC